MNTLEIIFIASIAILFYTYIGYGILIRIISLFRKPIIITEMDDHDLPNIAHIVASYNEGDIIEEKILNSLSLDYPKDKLKTILVTDGSNDNSAEIIKKYPGIIHFHRSERAGKLAAVNRVIRELGEPIVVFSDANAMLSIQSLRKMAGHFQNNRVGAVAGEKIVLNDQTADAASAGEGIYWKYESWLKKMDYKINTVVGAAGELFAVRRHLYQSPEKDVLIEDFITSMHIAKEGYIVAYEPEAKAVENASFSVTEEAKRKIRISAGGLQAVIRLYELLNPFRFGMLSFQYISHRVLRWTLAPMALFTVFWSNIILAKHGHPFYDFTMFLQVSFYLLALIGYYLESQKLKIKVFFVPFYFIFMNACVYLGAARLMKGNTQVTWEKALRKS